MYALASQFQGLPTLLFVMITHFLHSPKWYTPFANFGFGYFFWVIANSNRVKAISDWVIAMASRV